MRRSVLVVAGAIGAVVLGTWASHEAEACAPAPPPGLEVRIRGEGALIAWDPARKLEHFIRYARFDTSGRASDFGFLVPTPTKPELAEASMSLFHDLERAVLPERVTQVDTRLVPTGLCFSTLAVDRSPPTASAQGFEERARAVEVLHQVSVSGYDAAVLAANDVGALARWLKDHGYDERPALTAWLKKYVQAGWIITAFKVTGGATAPVRISFQTERPFYPYREPEDARRPDAPPMPRKLRVFFVGPERVTGTIGDAITWPGALSWARPLVQGRVRELLGPAVPADGLAAGDLWLHAFEDASSPRPGTDEVFFARGKDQSEVVPPPIVVHETTEVPVPVDVILALGVVPAVVLVRRRRARRAGKGA